MSLESGVQTGLGILNTFYGLKRARENDTYQDELRKRERQEYEDLQAIRRAGDESLSLKSGSNQVAQPAGTPDVNVQPVRAPDVSMRGMEADGAPQPPAGEPAQPRAPLPPVNPGMMRGTPEVTSEQSIKLPQAGTPDRPAALGATNPAGAADMQRLDGRLPRQQTFSDMEALNTKLMASMRKAIELGRPDLALQYQQQGMQVRDALRKQAGDVARSQYQATGDPSVYVPFFNQYVSNGVSVDSIRPQGDGYVMAGRTDEGKTFERPLSKAQFEQYIRFAQDPQGARALEAKYAEELYKSQMKRIEEQEKNRFQKVGNTLVDTQSGQRFDGTTHHVVKNADGGERVVSMEGPNQVGGAGSAGAPISLPKPVADRVKETSRAVFNAYGPDSLGRLNPEFTDAALKSGGMAERIAIANHGTPNWDYLQPTVIAEIAKSVTDGKTKVIAFRDGSTGRIYRGVEWDGRRVLLDQAPQMQRFGGERSSITMQRFGELSKGLPPEAVKFAKSIFQQESSSGQADTSGVNESNVTGPMQVKKETFDSLKAQNLIPQSADWRDPEDNTAAGIALINYLWKKFDGDPKKVAAAYYSGEKAIRPDGSIADLRNPRRPNDPSTRQYADAVTARMGLSQVKGLGTRTVSGPVN